MQQAWPGRTSAADRSEDNHDAYVTIRRRSSRRVAALAAGLTHAQGRGGGAWTTTGGDAQRTAWVRTDPRISKESLGKAPLQLLWKRQLEKPAGQRRCRSRCCCRTSFPTRASRRSRFSAAATPSTRSTTTSTSVLAAQPRRGAPAPRAACAAGPVAVSRSTPVAPAGSGAGRGGGGGGGGRGGGNNVYAVSTSGMVHALNPQTGEDRRIRRRNSPAAPRG